MNTQAIMSADGADKIVTSIMVCSSCAEWNEEVGLRNLIYDTVILQNAKLWLYLSLRVPRDPWYLWGECENVNKARCLSITRIIPGFILDSPGASKYLIRNETYHPYPFVLLRRDEGTSVNGIFTTLTGEWDIQNSDQGTNQNIKIPPGIGLA